MTRKKKASLQIDVITLFPGMFDGPLSESLLGRAQKNGLIQIRIHSLRQWSGDPRHQKVDDRPFGGGAGMVIQAEPIYRALKKLGGLKKGRAKPWVVFLSPQGDRLTQPLAGKLRKKKNLILLCGHYEGIDERAMEWVDQEVSIGDVVLTGGEIPALALIDAVGRLVPGVVGDPESLVNESFSGPYLDFPHFTRPASWRGRTVPEALLSGNHQKIQQWRAEQAVKRTAKKRPDLIKNSQPRRVKT